MTRDVQRDPQSMMSRRTLVHGLALAAGATAAGAGSALAQTAAPLGPPSTITTPPRDEEKTHPPIHYTLPSKPFMLPRNSPLTNPALKSPL